MNDVNEVEDVAVAEAPVVEDVQPDLGYLLNPARHENESYEDYRVRRSSTNKSVKRHIQNGRLIHNSRPDPERKGVTYHKVAA